MKHGRTLTDLARELDRQINSRKDFIAPQGALDAVVVDGEVVLDGLNGTPVSLQPYAHKQLAQQLGIPQAYYDRMKAQKPDLLADNVRTWLKDAPEEKRMVRTLDGKARAILSAKYRPLDNYELFEAVYPTLSKYKVQVMSAELTETRMYIKGILPELSDQLPDGMFWGEGHHRVDGLVLAAVTISNSEVGAGTLRIEPSVYSPWCTNLAVLIESAMKKYHFGRAFSADDAYEIFRDATRKADDTAFFMKVQDITEQAFAKDAFQKAIEDIKQTVDRPIKGQLPAVVDLTVEELGLPKPRAGSILTYLAKGGDLTQWGLASAITRASQDDDVDYELATEMEHAGGKVLALKPTQWAKLAEAVAATEAA